MMARSDIKSVREFLELQLNDRSMRHLISWSNEEQGKFQIFWLHAGRSSYNRNEHQVLFVKYRKYRGRTESDDPKQTFRMALKKSPHIECLAVHQDDDWRHYIFKQKNNSSVMQIPSRTSIWVDDNANNVNDLSYIYPNCDYDSAYGSTPSSPGGSSQPPSSYHEYPPSPVRNPSNPVYQFGQNLSPNDPYPPRMVPASRPRLLSQSSTDHVHNGSYSGGTCIIPETESHINSYFSLQSNLQNNVANSSSSANTIPTSIAQCILETASTPTRHFQPQNQHKCMALKSESDSNVPQSNMLGYGPINGGTMQDSSAPGFSSSYNTTPTTTSQCYTPSEYYQQPKQSELITQRFPSEMNITRSQETGYGSIDDSPDNWTDNYGSLPNIHYSTPTNCSAPVITIPPVTSQCIPEIKITSAQEFFQQQNQNKIMKQRSAPWLNSGYGPVDESPDNWADNYDNLKSTLSSVVSSTTDSQEMKVQEAPEYVPNMYNNSSTNVNEFNVLSNQHQNVHKGYIHSGENNVHNSILDHNPSFPNSYPINPTHSSSLQPSPMEIQREYHMNTSQTSGYGSINECPDLWMEDFELYTDSTI